MSVTPQKTDEIQRATSAGAAADLVRPFGGDDFDRDVWSVLGVPIDIATGPQAVQAIETAARDGVRLSFVTPNVNFLVRALKDGDARRQLINADLSLVDGAPLVAIARLLGAPVRERCAGSDVFDALRRRPGFAGRRLRVFFFGGRDGAAEAAAAAIDKEKRGLESAGWLNPGHGDLESMSAAGIIEAINDSNADFVLVALGAAKGQAWIDLNRARLAAPVIAHLGAVIDFSAGSIGRAPPLIRKAGLEWAWRIKEEPALWRRYWNDGWSLLSILATRLAPALEAGSRSGSTAPARAQVRRLGGEAVVALQGDLVAENRAAVRDALRAAAGYSRAVLDLSAVRRIDASFLGLALMLEKAMIAKGGRIAVAGASSAHRRIFRAHAMNYEFVDAVEAFEGDAIAAAV